MRSEQRVIERYSHFLATALRRLTAARMVHQDATDHLRTQREKVHAILAADAVRARQLQIGLIGQRGRLQTFTRRAAAQVPPRDAPKLRINDGHPPVERYRIAVVPCDEQSADVLGIVIGHDPFRPSFAE
jgi:hypothetical protein